MLAFKSTRWRLLQSQQYCRSKFRFCIFSYLIGESQRKTGESSLCEAIRIRERLNARDLDGEIGSDRNQSGTRTGDAGTKAEEKCCKYYKSHKRVSWIFELS